MRTLFSAAFLLITSVSAFSQDTLFTRSGKIIPGKVYEINQTDIKYKKPSNPDGPLYTISKEDIAVIEYKNGTKDVFESNGDVQNYAANTAPQSQPQINNNYYGNPVPRPNVNVVLGMGVPFWGYRPYYYYRPYRYYGGGWGGCRGWHHGHGHHR